MSAGPQTLQLEREYRDARFGEYARISRNVALAGGVLVLVLWIRDVLHDPLRAHETVVLRILMAGGAFCYAAALWLNVRRGLVLVSGYLAVLLVEFSIFAIWSRLDAGWAASFPGYLYIYLVLPLIMLPFSFRETVLAVVLVPLVPNAQVLAGLAPGFPLAAFNAMIWPACGITLFASLQYERLLRRLFSSQGRLQDLAARDELTGLGNRRLLMERGTELVKLAQRHSRPLAALMLDLDHFKVVNDRYGHAAGDDVLRFLAAAVTLQLRASDLAGRSGGEEFVLLLPETSLAQAAATAERLRESLARTPVPTDEAHAPIPVTVSIGVAALRAQDETLDALLVRADAAMYEAKRAGRNCVRVAQDPAGGGGMALATGRDSPRN